MALLERVKKAIGGGDEEIAYRYHCRECAREFETPETSMKAITCPNCGASGSRSIERL